jgi:hypothetical protein
MTNATHARADVASDATAIIEQVIEDDIARQIVPSVACKMPLANDYFPGTVGAIESERFSGLPVILRKEASDLLGLAVIRELDPALLATSVSVPTSPPAATTPPAATATLTAPPPAASGAAVTLALSLPVPRVVPRQAVHFTAEQSVMLDNLTGPRTGTRARTRKSPLNVKGTASSSATTLTSLGTNNVALTSTATAAATTEPQCQFLPSPGKPGTSKATAQMSSCLQPQGTIQAELACAVALTVRDAADGDDNLLPNDAQRVAAALMITLLSEASPQWKPGSESVWVVAATKLVEDLAQHSPDATTATDFCKALAAAPSTGAPVAPDPACVTDVEKALTIVKTRVSLNTLDQAFALVQQVVSDGCSGTPPMFGAKWCSSPAKNYLMDASGDAIDVISDIRSKNYGAAAKEIIDSSQQLTCDDPKFKSEPECTEQAKTVYAFLEALAEYSVDTLVSGAPPAAADATFRQAAIALIEQEGGAGVRRSLTKDAAGLWVPEFALREAWRPGHIGPSGGETLAYPSIDLLRGRLPIPTFGSHHQFYLNVHGSLLDPLGPFVEVSTRDASLHGASASTTVFGLGFIVPRVDVEFAVPELSKNLVIGLGGALRFFRAEGVPGAAHYCTMLDGTCTGSTIDSDNVELSAFVKYVP